MLQDKPKWTDQLASLSDDEQKVLTALSFEDYGWRTKSGGSKATCIIGADLQKTLSSLMKNDIVRPAISKNKELTFGLKEVVG